MKKYFSLIAIITLIFNTASAYADALEQGSEAFESRISAYQEYCSSFSCKVPFSERTAFDLKMAENSTLDHDTKNILEQVAFDQAQIWGDTILEGDYHADGNTQLDRVYTIYENDQFLGYKITYSERAWYTGDCQFSYENEESLSECEPGRIYESSFVSPDFNTYFRDENELADFRNE